MMSVGILIFFSVCGLGLFASHGKFISFLLTLIVCFGMLNAVGYADYEEYSTAYELVLFHSNEFFRYPAGWTHLCRVFASFGIPFNTFHTLIIAISLILFFIVFHHYSRDVNLAFSLFGLYPLLIECIQFRSMLAVAICTLSLLLLEKPGYKRLLLYVFCVLLAMQFHTSVVIFLLPAVISVYRQCFGQKSSKGSAYVLILSITLLLVVFFIARYAPQLISFFLHDRDATYLDDITSHVSTVIRLAIVYLFNAYISVRVANVIQENGGLSTKQEIAFVMQTSNLLLIAGVALLFFNTNFYRFLRFFYPINIALLAFAFEGLQNKKAKAQLVILGILYVLLGTTLDLFWTFDITAAPILNGIVSWLK